MVPASRNSLSSGGGNQTDSDMMEVAQRKIQNSVGRKVRNGSLEKMSTFMLCIQKAFVIILSTLLLRNGLSV